MFFRKCQFVCVGSYDVSIKCITITHHFHKKNVPIYQNCFSIDLVSAISVAVVTNPFSVRKLETYTNWTSKDLSIMKHVLADDMHVCFGNTVCRQVAGIYIGNNCTPPIANLLFYC